MSQQKVIDFLKKYKELSLTSLAKKIGLGVQSTSKNLHALIKQGLVKRELENRKEVFNMDSKIYPKKNKRITKKRFKYIYRLK